MMGVRVQDVTLRDGNHALRHSLDLDFVRAYCAVADKSTVDVVEVGHGMGLGASSHLVGQSTVDDINLLEVARQALPSTLLGVHSIPGFSTLEANIKPAIEVGVDVFRIATHVTEADTAAPHLEYVRGVELEAVGVLMMSHMASISELVQQARTMQKHGASSLIIMDSSGHYTPRSVEVRIRALVDELDINVGFHAHNNFNAAIANSLAALRAGAKTIDATAMGLGAGAGNAQLECLMAVLEFECDWTVDLEPYLQLSQLVEQRAGHQLPRTTASSVISGKSGVVSAFAPYVKQVSEELGIPSDVLWSALGERRIVAGQESIIREVALEIAQELSASTQRE